MKPKLTIANEYIPSQESATELLADQIKAICDGIRKLRSGRLNDRALFLLIQHACPVLSSNPQRRVSISQIKSIFDGLEKMEKNFMKKSAAA